MRTQFLFLIGLAAALSFAPLFASEPKKNPPPSPSAASGESAAQPTKPSEPTDKTVEQLTQAARKSVVVVTQTGRDGQRAGLGAGFIVSADGLIVTNAHVIGEARPITVQLADGKPYDVISVHAFDRALDLAVVRIDAHDLPALPLGDSDSLKQGQSILAIGNPQGLKHSVVTGVVSGVREVEGRSMIQLAIPIEPGNSGGPLLDMQGRVHGILTMKSAITANLGFAVSINTLKPLLEKPNPIAMSRWLTIGALDPRQWQPLFGARWRQRAGRIAVEGLGSGFGGRSLCLYQQPAPQAPFELAVNVKLDDEAGAAGLAFGADGDQKHFGFYPSAGKLRLTRFDGPDVFSWKVLEERPSPHYNPGSWNQLRVRIADGKISCFVNEQLVIEAKQSPPPDGKIGLAKFRDTRAEFKNFRVGTNLIAEALPAERLQEIWKLIDTLPTGDKQQDAVAALAPQAAAGELLRERAKSLDEQATRLRRLAQQLHEHRVVTELAEMLSKGEEAIDLSRAALLIAKLDNEELDVNAYVDELRHMGREIADKLAADATPQTKLAALGKYLFEENGFHGSRGDYYNRSNSYLNEVIDDREGLPITLSVLYMELARQMGLNVVGLGLPGHFVVGYQPSKGALEIIDVYEGAKAMTRAEAAERVRNATGRDLEDADLTPATKRAILVRMLRNLQGLAAQARDSDAVLRYLTAILALDPESAADRWVRAVVSYSHDRKDLCQLDCEWLLAKQPSGIDLERVHELRQMLREGERTPAGSGQ